MQLEIEYLHEGMDPLYRAHPYDAGADVPLWRDVTVKHGKNVIDLGFKLILPPGYMGIICARSSVMGDGIAYNTVPFDSDYAATWNMIFYNPGEEFELKKGQRICQVVILPIIYAEFVTKKINRRGAEGQGSTGK